MNRIFFDFALKEAEKAFKKKEVPVGAVVVLNGKILSRAHNLREQKQTICTHAELLALEKACKKLGSWRLQGCEVYVTLEPCAMCMGALQQARVSAVYFGAWEKKFGAVSLGLDIHQNPKMNHRFEATYVETPECSAILSKFFKTRRAQKK